MILPALEKGRSKQEQPSRKDVGDQKAKRPQALAITFPKKRCCQRLKERMKIMTEVVACVLRKYMEFIEMIFFLGGVTAGENIIQKHSPGFPDWAGTSLQEKHTYLRPQPP